MGRVGFNLDTEDGTASVRIAGQDVRANTEGIQEVRAGLGRTGVTIDKKGIKEVSIDLVPSIPSVPLLDENPGPRAKIERLDGDRGYQTTVEAGGGQARVSLGIGGDGLTAETQSGPSETEGVIDGSGKIRLESRTQLVPGGESEASTEVIVDGCSISVRNTFFNQNFGFDLTLPSCKKPEETVAPPPSTGQGTADDQSWNAEGDLPDFRATCRYKIWFLIERNEHLYAGCTGYAQFGGCTGYQFTSFSFNSLPGKLYLKAPTKYYDTNIAEWVYFMNVGGILGALYVCGPRSGGLACTEGADFTQNAPGGFPGVIGIGEDAHIQTPEGYGVTYFDNVLGSMAASTIADQVAVYKSFGGYTNIRVFVVESWCPAPLVARQELPPDYTSGPSGPPPPWSYPPTIPMDKSCCSMLRKIMEYLEVEAVRSNGFATPNRLMIAGGVGNDYPKTLPRILANIIRIMAHGLIVEPTTKIKDASAVQAGKQEMTLKYYNATGWAQAVTEMLMEVMDDGNSNQNMHVRTGVHSTQLMVAIADLAAKQDAILDALGTVFQPKVEKISTAYNLALDIPDPDAPKDKSQGKGFDPKKNGQQNGGKANQKQQDRKMQKELDKNTDEAIEALLPKFLQGRDNPVKTVQFDPTAETLYEVLREIRDAVRAGGLQQNGSTPQADQTNNQGG